ncbi:MAG: hypothetical protein KF708_24560 [Pirellulales bacterium]|nr:hypothetical protein [Pirellulales bacterium]
MNRISRFLDNDVSNTFNSGDTDITVYEWDHRNRLTKVTERATFSGANTFIVGYLYDAFDRRTGKNVDTDGNGTDNYRERYIYDGDDVILDFLDADAGTANYTVAKRYLHGPAVDQLLAEEDGSVTITAADRVGLRQVLAARGRLARAFGSKP